MADRLCASCEKGIYCPTWADYKCLLKMRRIYSSMPLSRQCSDYKKRGTNFKETDCQCEDCLKNDDLWELNNEE